jgi:hypothetical protein
MNRKEWLKLLMNTTVLTDCLAIIDGGGDVEYLWRR